MILAEGDKARSVRSSCTLHPAPCISAMRLQIHACALSAPTTAGPGAVWYHSAVVGSSRESGLLAEERWEREREVESARLGAVKLKEARDGGA